MSESTFHVLIIGGGLGGLCLAQGLKQTGISVALYERDAAPALRKQGYRLHIDERGAGALRACLPSHLYELFTATASRPGHQVTVLNKRLKMLKVIGGPRAESAAPTPFNAGVDRLTLREILLAGLDEVVTFGKEFSHFVELEDGTLQVHFADGSTARGNVLVGADGAHSRLRQQLLPAAPLVDTGTRCIYGKMLLSATTRPLVPEAAWHGFTVIAAPPLSLALGLVEFARSPGEVAAQLAPGLQLHTSGSYLMWSLNARRERFAASDEDFTALDGPALKSLVLRQVAGWHPQLQTIITASDPTEIFPIAVRVAAPCAAWESTSITLLGDAIHAMSPAGGSGANMALRDAQRLCEALISAFREKQPLRQAIHEYETQMLKEGFAAVNFANQGGVLARARAGAPWLARLFARR